MLCPECGAETPTLEPCAVCGHRQLGALELSGPAGRLRTSAPMNIDQTSYRRRVGADCKYADNYPDWQYRVFKAEDLSGWLLEAAPKTTQLVVLNGAECAEKTPYPLHDGDVIELGSRKNAGVRVARVDVHIG